MPKYKLMKYFPVALIFLSGFILGSIVKLSLNPREAEKDNVYEIRAGGYRFINPLLECETLRGSPSKELISFKYKIEKYIDWAKDAGRAESVSVYFRDLNNGPWFGINEKDEFAPASLLKIPIMLAWLKCAEGNPAILKESIKYESDVIEELPQEIKPRESVKKGKSYTIEDLIYRMIVYSDNRAKNLLLLNINEDSLNGVYRDLGMDIPGIRTPSDFMSVKEYGAFFRILFNASYLSKKASEWALETLSKSDFKDGLVAGVPTDIVVAHKFGERTSTNLHQLHDCGIIYYEKHPYLLCVMTRGKDFKELSEIIKNISRIIYTEIDNQYSSSIKN